MMFSDIGAHQKLKTFSGLDPGFLVVSRGHRFRLGWGRQLLM